MIVNAPTVRRLLRQHGISPGLATPRIETRGHETDVHCAGREWMPVVGAALTYGWSDAVARIQGGVRTWSIRRFGAEEVGPLPPMPDLWPAEPLGLQGWAWLVYAELHHAGSLDGSAPHRLDHDTEMALMRSPWTALVDPPPAAARPDRRRLVVSSVGSTLIRTALRRNR